MENVLFNQNINNYKRGNKTEENKGIFNEDPINQINLSLEQLLFNLKKDSTIPNDNIEFEIYNDYTDINKNKEIFNQNDNQENYLDISNNDENNLNESEEKEEFEDNLLIPYDIFIEK